MNNIKRRSRCKSNCIVFAIYTRRGRDDIIRYMEMRVGFGGKFLYEFIRRLYIFKSVKQIYVSPYTLDISSAYNNIYET